MSKLYRRLTIIAAPLIIVGAVAISNSLANKKQTPERTDGQVNILPEVPVMTVQNGSVTMTLDIQGELVAFDKIAVFSEVAGVLKPTGKAFKVGTRFKKGEVLLSIDREEAELALLSQKSTLLNAVTQLMPDLKIDYPESFSQWKKYLDDFDIEQSILPFPKPLNEPEKYFIASRNLYTQFYNIKSAETRLGKFKIYAPFRGVVTRANTNPGALVSPGQNLGELMNTGVYELLVTVPMGDLKFLKPGNAVELVSDVIGGQWTGRVKRIGDQIERSTQTATVFIGVSGKNLREGMYLRGKSMGAKVDNAVKIPRNLIVNQNAVFAVRDSFLTLQPVDIVKVMEDEAVVKGLENGTQILKEPVPGIREGMKVIIRD